MVNRKKQLIEHCGVGPRLRKLLADRGMTRRELQRRSGVSYHQILNIIDGKCEPRDSTFGLLAAALRLTPSALMGENASSGDEIFRGDKGLVVKEERAAYTVRSEDVSHPEPTIDDCVKALARQFSLPEQETRSRLLRALLNDPPSLADTKEVAG